ncbi:MAG: hypothetical protein ACT4NY_27030 [Pseudonocardiales bacterium]
MALREGGIVVTRRASGTTAHAAPTGWAHLRGGASPEGYTIRWQRGDQTAHILPGNQVGSHTSVGVLTTMDVPPHGWTDLSHLRAHGQRWLSTHNGTRTRGRTAEIAGERSAPESGRCPSCRRAMR